LKRCRKNVLRDSNRAIVQAVKVDHEAVLEAVIIDYVKEKETNPVGLVGFMVRI
jgi:hypothetical protein